MDAADGASIVATLGVLQRAGVEAVSVSSAQFQLVCPQVIHRDIEAGMRVHATKLHTACDMTDCGYI